MTPIPPSFIKFLKLFHSHHVEYLVVGGYAVVHHGYVRTTEDIDLWVARNPENARRIVAALGGFGFTPEEARESFFLDKHQIVRMGIRPFRIEIITTISGVDFADCFARKEMQKYGDIEVPYISLPDLLINKKASGRLKDLADLENLPGGPPRKPSARAKKKRRDHQR